MCLCSDYYVFVFVFVFVLVLFYVARLWKLLWLPSLPARLRTTKLVSAMLQLHFCTPWNFLMMIITSWWRYGAQRRQMQTTRNNWIRVFQYSYYSHWWLLNYLPLSQNINMQIYQSASWSSLHLYTPKAPRHMKSLLIKIRQQDDRPDR